MYFLNTYLILFGNRTKNLLKKIVTGVILSYVPEDRSGVSISIIDLGDQPPKKILDPTKPSKGDNINLRLLENDSQ